MSRFFKRGRCAGATLGASLVLVSACSAPSKGSLVLAISTDMQTPKDINLISLFVSEGKDVKFDFVGHVLPEGTVALPATLALVEPDDPSTQVQIRIIGFNNQTAKVLRDIQTTVPHQRAGLLRVPLDFIDTGSGTGTLPDEFYPGGPDTVAEGLSTFDPSVIASKCDPDKLCLSGDPQCMTTVNGACGSGFVDPGTLPTYVDQAVFGDAGMMSNGTPTSCFSVETCFAGAAPMTSVTATECVFPFPEGSTPATLNVGLVTPSTGACVAPGQCYVPLAEDPNEGWTLQGNMVTLAKGVCSLIGNGVTVVASAGQCAALTLSQPVCEPTGEDASTSAPEAATTDDAGDEATTDDAGDEATTPEAGGAEVDASVAADAGAGVPDAGAPVDAAPGSMDAATTAADASASMGCTSNAMCTGATPICAITIGVCLQCVATTDCAAGSTCSGTVCVPQGAADASAPADASTGPGACVAAPSGIVSWWTGDGTFADLTGANPGTPTGNVTFTTGLVGSAFLFDGTDYVSAGTANLPAGNTDRTIELWARDDTPSAANSLFAGYGGNYNLYDDDNQLGFGSPAGLQLTSPNAGAQGVWTHLAVTYTGGLGTLYVNGMSVASGTFGLANPNAENAFIGGVLSAPDGAERLVGAVDEVTVYDRALTAAEVVSISAAGSAGKCKSVQVGGADSGSASDATLPSDATSGADAGTTAFDASTGATCEGGATICGASCVNEQTDPANCGSCGFTCSAGFICSNGACGSATTAITAGSQFACALQSGTGYCWGYNAHGELGMGTTSGPESCNAAACSLTPFQVSGLTTIASMSAGTSSACALLTGGAIDCWGDNTYFQLANSSLVNSPTPISTDTGGSAIAVGDNFACLQTVSGSVQCWGSNSYGEFGTGSNTGPQVCTIGDYPCSSTPTTVAGVAGVSSIGAGQDEFACAVSDGSLRCWGINDDGQVTGNPTAGTTCGGDEGSSLTCFPSDQFIGSVSNVSQVAPGGDFTCALTATGSVYCWGTNTHGECGTGGMSASTSPNLVTLSNVTSIATGYDFACAILQGGSVVCWGDNSIGQLGNGTTANTGTPTLVVGLGTVTAITAGRDFACALSQGGYVQCWGNNAYGQLGNGTTNGSLVPVGVQWSTAAP